MPTRAICMDAWFGHQAPPPPASLFRDKRTKMTPKKNNISSGSISLTTRQMCVRVTWNLHQQDGGSGGRPDTFFAIIISLPPAQFAVEINRHRMKKRKKRTTTATRRIEKDFLLFLIRETMAKVEWPKGLAADVSHETLGRSHIRENTVPARTRKLARHRGHTHTHTQVDALLFNRFLCNG